MSDKPESVSPDRMYEIYKEVILGMPSDLKNDEEREIRRIAEAEADKAKAEGHMLELPFEW